MQAIRSFFQFQHKIKLIKTEIEKLNGQISRFIDLYSLGMLPIEQISAKIQPLNEQRNALERELESVSNEVPIMTEEEVADVVSSFNDVLSRGNIDEVRLVLETLIDRIELDNDDVYIHWKFA